MGSASLDAGTAFLTQAGAGILGNSFLFGLLSFTLLTGHKLTPTDMIRHQLGLASSLVLFSRGTPQTMAEFGWKNFLDDARCKPVVYLHRVARGVSLSPTCLLNGFQALKLCLRTSRSDRFTVALHAGIFFSFAAVCLGRITWASGSTVILLTRHKQRVQHVLSSSHSARASHEARATRTILVLASAFVFYSLSCTSALYVMLTASPGQWLVDLSVFLASCFPTLSPFLLITSDIRISRLFFDFWARISFIADLPKQL
ncbi:vomeronasal type-1 receptor 1-like [Vicugna pacos]|uniref:Vomeronasal type-1 receptor n=1 Tax=Vicugna pacos TaxID=30538 RepID=A0ABM5DVN9_VICPA